MKYFFTTFIFLNFFIPTFLYAQTDYVPLADYDGILEPAIKGGFSTYLNTIMGIMIAIAAIAAVVMIVAGGLQYMTTDAVNSKADGKKKITSAIGGLILALSSWLILNTINPNILEFDFKVDNVAKEVNTYDLIDFFGADPNNIPIGAIPDFVNDTPFTPNGLPPKPKATALQKNEETVLRNTKYYVSEEGDFKKGSDGTFILSNGKTIKANSEYVRLAEIEGTARLLDGTVLNYSSGSRSGGNYRWIETSNQYGLGNYDNPLTPYRSVAVDPDRIALGSKLFIRETVGMPIPVEYGGGRHDGIWYAHDVGSAIQNDRVDLFVGSKKYESVVGSYKGVGHLNGLHTVILDRPE